MRTARVVFRIVIGCAALTQAASAQDAAFHETLVAPLDAKLPAYRRPVECPSGDIRSVGADTMASLMKLWIRDFNAICPDIHFVVVSEGSMTGIPALLDESADIAPMAREPLESEMQLYRAKFGHEPFGVEVAGGAYRKPSSSPALVFFVNEKNPIGRLTLEQLDAILSTTRKRGYPSEIMTWGELGATGEWKAAPIHLYTVKQPNGIPHFLQVRVSLGGDFKNTFAELGIKQAVPVMDRMAQVAADDRFALSYAALSNQKPGTKAVALAEKRGAAFYLPTFQAVLNRHYPLARPIYFYINRPLGTSLKPSVEAFLKFILSREGQKDVVEEGVMLPLPETEVAQQLRALH